MLTKNTDQLKAQVQLQADRVDEKYYRGKSNIIGSLSHSGKPETNEDMYGLPVMLQWIAESIFEGMNIKDATEFLSEFPNAVGCDGKDLSRVGWKFLAHELHLLPPQPVHIQEVIDPVITGMDLLAKGSPWPEADARAAVRASEAVYRTSFCTRAAHDAAQAFYTPFKAWLVTSAVAANKYTYPAPDYGIRNIATEWRARLRQKELLLKLISEAEVEQCS
jgi:hypothetical protein